MSRRRARSTVRTALLTALAVLAIGAAPAVAATTASVDGGVLLVTAAPGETNEVSVSESVPPGSSAVSEYGIRDPSAGTAAGPGCVYEPSSLPQNSRVVCSAAGVQSIVIRLG